MNFLKDFLGVGGGGVDVGLPYPVLFMKVVTIYVHGDKCECYQGDSCGDIYMRVFPS